MSWHLWLAAELRKAISHKCVRWLRHKGGTTSTYQAVEDLETSCHPPSRSHITAFQRCHSPFPCLHEVPRRMWPGAVQYSLNQHLQFSKSLEMSLQAVSKQISGFPRCLRGCRSTTSTLTASLGPTDVLFPRGFLCLNLQVSLGQLKDTGRTSQVGPHTMP